MKRPIALLALFASAITLAGCTSTAPPTGKTTRNIVAIGDSVSAASNSCGKNLACYDNSWATGDNAAIESVAERLNATVKSPYGVKNYAVLGTKLDGLGSQLEEALKLKPAYLTLLIGGNDFCADAPQDMTSVDHFQESFMKLTSLVREISPGTELIVASAPNPQTVYEAGKSNPTARKAWLAGNICQSLLADPLDDSAAADQRRQQVIQRATAFNRVLEENCTDSCTFDKGAVNRLSLTAADISTVDFFHMSTLGQAKIAAAAWENTLAATK